MIKKSSLELAKGIITKLRGNNHKTFFVGGCVRNNLLGRSMQDIDLVTSARPDQLIKLFPNARKVGRQFPVVLVKIDDTEIECATFRADDPSKESALKEDALKRDFTVNSLFYDPFENKIIDYTQGQSDLKQKILRFNREPNDRILEDPARLLRALRLAVDCQFEIEARSWQAIQDHATKINEVAKERLFIELEKLLLTNDAERGCRLLASSNLIQYLLPELYQTIGVEQSPHAHPEGDCFEHICLSMRYMPKPASRYLAWATFLHDIGKPVTQAKNGSHTFPNHGSVGADLAQTILLRYNSDNELIRQVCLMIEHHVQFGQVEQMKKSTLKRIMARDTFQDELNLYYADKMASNKKLDKYEKTQAMVQALSQDHHTLEKAFQLINGHDLKKLGLMPGPSYQTILTTIHDAFLDHQLSNREQALTMAKKAIEDFHYSQQS